MPSGKHSHSPCLLHQHIRRVGIRLFKFLRQDRIEAEDFHYECYQQDRLYHGKGPIWTPGRICRIDAEEWLNVVGEVPSGLCVKRKHYRYNATLTLLEEGRSGNIRRHESPDRVVPPSAPEHHNHHHVHTFWPFSGQKNEDILILDERETPTLPEFVQSITDWQSKHYEDLSSLEGLSLPVEYAELG